MGTWVSACPANATSPMRSEVRARTNSIAVCLATSMRFAGAKSSACMLPEMSTRSEEHTSELQSRGHLVCRLLLEKKKKKKYIKTKQTIYSFRIHNSVSE